MGWWEQWLGGIVGEENVFIVTWLLALVLCLLALWALLRPTGRP